MSQLAHPSAFADTEMLPAQPWTASRTAEPGLGTSGSATAEGQARRAALAVGVVPPTVLTALLAVVAGLIEPATGMALFALGTGWLVFEMHRYLRRMDVELESQVQNGPWG